ELAACLVLRGFGVGALLASVGGGEREMGGDFVVEVGLAAFGSEEAEKAHDCVLLRRSAKSGSLRSARLGRAPVGMTRRRSMDGSAFGLWVEDAGDGRNHRFPFASTL